MKNEESIRPIYKFDDKWKKWIKENIDRKSNQNDYLIIL